MSEPKEILKRLRSAFEELNSADNNSQPDSSVMPKPVPASIMLERIKSRKPLDSASNVTAFKSLPQGSSEFRMAARDGQKISPEVLAKMKKNREQAD